MRVKAFVCGLTVIADVTRPRSYPPLEGYADDKQRLLTDILHVGQDMQKSLQKAKNGPPSTGRREGGAATKRKQLATDHP